MDFTKFLRAIPLGVGVMLCLGLFVPGICFCVILWTIFQRSSILDVGILESVGKKSILNILTEKSFLFQALYLTREQQHRLDINQYFAALGGGI